MGMSLHPNPGAAAGRDGAVCVVWHPRGSAPEPALLEVLGRKGFRTIACDSPVEATAWVCASSGRFASGGATPAPVVLLLDRPGLLRGPDEVVDTVERYASRAVCWTFNPGDTPKLRRHESSKAMAGAVHPTAAGRPQALRLAGEGTLEDIRPVAVSERGEDDAAAGAAGSLRNLLTDQELAMLLDTGGPSPEQHPHPRRAPRS